MLLDKIGYWAFILYMVSVVISFYMYAVLQAAGSPTASPFASKYSANLTDFSKIRETVGNVSGNAVLQISESTGGIFAYSLQGTAAIVGLLFRIALAIPALMVDMAAVLSGHPLYPQILAIALSVGVLLQVAAFYYFFTRIASTVASLLGR